LAVSHFWGRKIFHNDKSMKKLLALIKIKGKSKEQIVAETKAVLESREPPKQRKWLGLDVSWNENKSALIGALKWIAFLLLFNAIRVLIFK